MGAVERFRRVAGPGAPDDVIGARVVIELPDSGTVDPIASREPSAGSRTGPEVNVSADRILQNAEEETLRARLHDDPNDAVAFCRLAEIVKGRANEGHEHTDPQRESDDSVWALAEEMARSPRAWYPLIELARLSIEDDRESALRRLSTAAERDPSGEALAKGVAMLREAGHPNDALGLGVGHWRPNEHNTDVGRQLVEAAVDANRLGEARRHLGVLQSRPDSKRLKTLISDMERLIEGAERGGPPSRTPTPPAAPAPSASGPAPAKSGRVVDIRGEKVAARIRTFFRR